MSNTLSHEVAYTCSHVFENSRPILFVSKMDGDWQFLCGFSDHQDEAPHIVGLGHLIERDNSLKDVLSMEEGFEAERNDAHTAWNYSQCNPEDYE